MKVLQVFIVCLFLIVSNESKAQNYFLLLDSCVNCELNYQGIDSIDTFSAYASVRMDSVFNVVPGKYKVYRFIQLTVGFDDRFLPDSTGYETKHDLLILKVDEKSHIVDGYTFALDNHEHPSKCSLYKLILSKKKEKFVSGLYLSKLKFELQFDNTYCGRDPIFVLSAILDNFECYPDLLEE